MKKITHEDVVFFNTKEQLLEYMELSGDTSFLEIEVNNTFPQIQSKHWSFCVNDQYDRNMWDTKQSALDRLVSYEMYKSINHNVLELPDTDAPQVGQTWKFIKDPVNNLFDVDELSFICVGNSLELSVSVRNADNQLVSYLVPDFKTKFKRVS